MNTTQTEFNDGYDVATECEPRIKNLGACTRLTRMLVDTTIMAVSRWNACHTEYKNASCRVLKHKRPYAFRFLPSTDLILACRTIQVQGGTGLAHPAATRDEGPGEAAGGARGD